MTQTLPDTSTAATNPAGAHRRYPAYRDSGIAWLGEIPAQWEVKRLKYVSRMRYGEALASETRESGDVAVFGSNGIVGTHNRHNTAGPCLIIGRKGSYGKVTYSSDQCFVIDTAYAIDGHETNSQIRWLFYALSCLNLDQTSQDTGVPGLSRELAYNHWMALPPVDEQRAIAAYLDRETARIDALVEKKQRLIELLREKRAALISHAVTRGLDPNAPLNDSGVPWLGRIPVGWRIGKLGAIASIKARLGWKGLKAAEYVDEGFIFLSTPNIKGNEIDFANVNFITAERYYESPEIMLKTGDVLIAKDGSTLGTAAWIRFLPAPATVNSSLAVVRPRESIDSAYLYWHLTSHYSQSVIQRMKDGMGVPHLFQADLRKFVILLPPFSEQRAIAAYLDRATSKLDTMTSAVERQIEKLKEFRAAVIAAAVTGKIDVRGEGERSV